LSGINWQAALIQLDCQSMAIGDIEIRSRGRLYENRVHLETAAVEIAFQTLAGLAPYSRDSDSPSPKRIDHPAPIDASTAAALIRLQDISPILENQLIDSQISI